MKLLVVLCALVAYASAASIPEAIYDGPIYELKLIEEGSDSALQVENEDNFKEAVPIRHRRVTCDVLSVQSQWLSINHSACAVRCLVQRRKGGSCQNGVCVCRD